jgi:hypothetical protein
VTREYATPLDEHMNRRRLDLGMKWRDVASNGGISYEAVRSARAGEGEPADLTKRGIERALKWQPGSVDAILAGGEPTPLDEAPAREVTVADLAAQLAKEREARMDLERRFEELLAQREEEKQKRGKTG